MKKAIFFLIILFSLLRLPAQQASFMVTATGTSAAMDSAIQYAAKLWSEYLISDVPIKVKVNYLNLTSMGPLGITFPNGVKNFSGAPVPDTWYASCLANSLTGQELNPGEVDMDIFINSYFDWYFGTDGNPPQDKHDFVSVMMHEMGHGLGFASLAKVADNLGSFGELEALDFFPLSPSFSFPDLEGLPSAFDAFLVNPVGNELSGFNNNSPALGALLTNNNVYFNGMWGISTNNGERPKIYAPSTYAIGTSITHLDESTFNGTENSLMTPFIAKGEVEHRPGPVILGVLADIGWPLAYPVGINEVVNSPVTGVQVYPNPFSDKTILEFILRYPENVQVEIYNLLGKRITQLAASQMPGGLHCIEWDGTNARGLKVTPGLYVYAIKAGHFRASGKIEMDGE